MTWGEIDDYDNGLYGGNYGEKNINMSVQFNKTTDVEIVGNNNNASNNKFHNEYHTYGQCSVAAALV